MLIGEYQKKFFKKCCHRKPSNHISFIVKYMTIHIKYILSCVIIDHVVIILMHICMNTIHVQRFATRKGVKGNSNFLVWIFNEGLLKHEKLCTHHIALHMNRHGTVATSHGLVETETPISLWGKCMYNSTTERVMDFLRLHVCTSTEYI